MTDTAGEVWEQVRGALTAVEFEEELTTRAYRTLQREAQVLAEQLNEALRLPEAARLEWDPCDETLLDHFETAALNRESHAQDMGIVVGIAIGLARGRGEALEPEVIRRCVAEGVGALDLLHDLASEGLE